MKDVLEMTREEMREHYSKVGKYVDSLLNDLTPEEIRDLAWENYFEFFEGLPEFEKLYEERFGEKN